MLTIALVATVLLPRVHAQPFDSAQGKRQEPLPEALTQMIEAERAFAARALVVGWKQAFLDASPTPRSGSTKAGRARARAGGEESGPAQRSAVDLGAALRRQRRQRRAWIPDRPRQEHPAFTQQGPAAPLQLLLGLEARRDGRFKVVMDVGTQTPPVPYATGFTRAPHANRFTGDYDDTTPPLGTADRLLNTALRSGQARAYRNQLADGVRFHRQNTLPIVGQAAVVKWLASQPSYSSIDSQYASRPDRRPRLHLGLLFDRAPPTVVAPSGPGTADHDARLGFYLRVWVRERNGQWKLAVDVLE